ncbi:MAG: hypothetical protein P9L93_00365 [Candidatus Gorgyraea atricola]|nr:hypothetical protein [Candidatus Gorgyraea atricola]
MKNFKKLISTLILIVILTHQPIYAQSLRNPLCGGSPRIGKGCQEVNAASNNTLTLDKGLVNPRIETFSLLHVIFEAKVLSRKAFTTKAYQDAFNTLTKGKEISIAGAYQHLKRGVRQGCLEKIGDMYKLTDDAKEFLRIFNELKEHADILENRHRISALDYINVLKVCFFIGKEVAFSKQDPLVLYKTVIGNGIDTRSENGISNMIGHFLRQAKEKGHIIEAGYKKYKLTTRGIKFAAKEFPIKGTFIMEEIGRRIPQSTSSDLYLVLTKVLDLLCEHDTLAYQDMRSLLPNIERRYIVEVVEKISENLGIILSKHDGRYYRFRLDEEIRNRLNKSKKILKKFPFDSVNKTSMNGKFRDLYFELYKPGLLEDSSILGKMSEKSADLYIELYLTLKYMHACNIADREVIFKKKLMNIKRADAGSLRLISNFLKVDPDGERDYCKRRLKKEIYKLLLNRLYSGTNGELKPVKVICLDGWIVPPGTKRSDLPRFIISQYKLPPFKELDIAWIKKRRLGIKKNIKKSNSKITKQLFCKDLGFEINLLDDGGMMEKFISKSDLLPLKERDVITIFNELRFGVVHNTLIVNYNINLLNFLHIYAFKPYMKDYTCWAKRFLDYDGFTEAAANLIYKIEQNSGRAIQLIKRMKQLIRPNRRCSIFI